MKNNKLKILYHTRSHVLYKVNMQKEYAKRYDTKGFVILGKTDLYEV